MKIDGIVETALHVEDVNRSAEFYERLFGLERISADDRFCALALPGNTVLLFFKKGGSLEPKVIPGGVIPPHDGAGRLHLAFKIPADSLESCTRSLTDNGVAIESRVHWERGGTSLYFRDPDEHLVELITPGCWPVY
jgi:catechol 2,3-dioxygenase-like lactoylglutathione lyase family enzyme